MAGNDIRNMSPETVKTLTNKELIAVNQDPLGIQGFKHEAKDSLEIWLKPLANDEWALFVLNRGKTAKPFTLDWKTFSVVDSLANRTLDTGKTLYKIRDLVQAKELGDTKKTLTTTIPSHDVLCLKLSLPKGKK